jgi:hypothetical protein
MKASATTLSTLFKAAHALTRKTVRPGDSYQATFGLCLSYLYKKGTAMSVEITTYKSEKQASFASEKRDHIAFDLRTSAETLEKVIAEEGARDDADTDMIEIGKAAAKALKDESDAVARSTDAAHILRFHDMSMESVLRHLGQKAHALDLAEMIGEEGKIFYAGKSRAYSQAGR